MASLKADAGISLAEMIHRKEVESLELLLDENSLQGEDMRDPFAIMQLLRRSLETTSIHLTVHRSSNVALAVEVACCAPNLKRLTISASFDYNGGGLHVLDLVRCLDACTKLRHFGLNWIGIFGNSDDEVQQEHFNELEEVIKSHRTLCSVSIEELYFLQDAGPNAWRQPDRLLSAVLAAKLKKIHFSAASAYYGRPVVRLETITKIFRHSHLESAELKHIAVWGSSQTTKSHKALAKNRRMRTLHFCDCTFASRYPVLSGITENQFIVDLALKDCDLSGGEGADFLNAMKNNSKLIVLDLSGANFMEGLEGENEQETRLDILDAVKGNRCLKELFMPSPCDNTERLEQTLYYLKAILRTNRSLESCEMARMPLPQQLKALGDSIQLSLDLNRVGFWSLSQDQSSDHDWLYSLVRATSPSCRYAILRQHPLFCLSGTRL